MLSRETFNILTTEIFLKKSNTLISSEVMFYGVHFEKVCLEQGSENFFYKKSNRKTFQLCGHTLCGNDSAVARTQP